MGDSLNSSGVIRAFLYTGGKGMTDLGALGGPKANSLGHRHQCRRAGGGLLGDQRPASIHAFLYSAAAGMKDLGALGGEQ